MKHIILFALCCTFLGCGASGLRSTDPAIAAKSPVMKSVDTLRTESRDPGRKKLNPPPEIHFSGDSRLKEIVDFLASDELKGRETGSPGIEKAAQYLENSLRKNRIAPYFTSYRDTLSNFPKPAYNIVGMIEGRDKELKDQFVIIGAHYDHIGILTPQNGDSIANGANDNASGTATVLELLRYFSRARVNKRSMIFAFFSAEEKGLLGSRHLAGRLKAEGMDVYTMLNMEMTGVPMVGKDYELFLTGFEKSNMARICNGYAGKNLIGLLPSASAFNLFQRSDNYPFHEIFRVPSQTFCTFDFTNFQHYHKAADEASEMDFTHMAHIVNQMIPVIIGITNSPTKEILYY